MIPPETGQRVSSLALLLILLTANAAPAICQEFAGLIEASTAVPFYKVDYLDFAAESDDLGQLFELPLSDPEGINFLFNEPARAFAFADDSNSFYVGMVTGRSIVPPRIGRGVDGYVRAIYQTRVYVKGSQTPTPTTFTTTPSYLEIKAATTEQSVQMTLHAYLCSVDQILLIDSSGEQLSCLEQGFIYVRIAGMNDPDFDPDTDNHTYRLTQEIIEGDGLTGGTFEVVKRGQIRPIAEGARYDLPSRVGTFNLTPIIAGESFYFRYLLKVTGVAYDEGGSRGFLGDPLDVNPGISMQIGDGIELADPQPQLSLQQCAPNMLRATPDSRFVALTNGTVNDTETGLNWPRCPQGHSLNDAGTADLADDSCLPAGTTEFSWQEALQEGIDAADRGDYGNSDWRLPNAKELTTLVETACSLPAMNTSIFPEGTINSIWTNTPSDFGFAFAIDFSSGQLDTLSQMVAPSGVRLVRQADQFPPVTDHLFSDGFEQ